MHYEKQIDKTVKFMHDLSNINFTIGCSYSIQQFKNGNIIYRTYNR